MSTSYFHKVPPVNVSIITPYKDIWTGFSSQGKHIPTKVLLKGWQGNKIKLNTLPSSPTSRKKKN